MTQIKYYLSNVEVVCIRASNGTIEVYHWQRVFRVIHVFRARLAYALFGSEQPCVNTKGSLCAALVFTFEL